MPPTINIQYRFLKKITLARENEIPNQPFWKTLTSCSNHNYLEIKEITFQKGKLSFY